MSLRRYWVPRVPGLVAALSADCPTWLRVALLSSHWTSVGLEPGWVGTDTTLGWLFRVGYEVCCAIDNRAFDPYGDDHEKILDFARGHTMTVRNDLFRWAADHCLSPGFRRAEDRAEKERDFTIPTELGTYLASVQAYAIEDVAYHICRAMAEHRAETVCPECKRPLGDHHGHLASPTRCP